MEKGSRALYGRIKIGDALKSQDFNSGRAGVSRLRLGPWHIRYRVEQKNDFGGDMFSVLPLGQNESVVFLGDIAGHDFSAAIIAAPVLDYLETNRGQIRHLGAFMRSMFADLYKEIGTLNRFFTCFICVLRQDAGKLTWTNCGHPDGLLFRSGGAVERLKSSAPPIGVEKAPAFECQTLEFSPDDSLTLYTDGILDAFSKSSPAPGEEALLAGGGREGAIDDLFARIKAGAGPDGMIDDCSMVVIGK